MKSTLQNISKFSDKKRFSRKLKTGIGLLQETGLVLSSLLYARTCQKPGHLSKDGYRNELEQMFESWGLTEILSRRQEIQ